MRYYFTHQLKRVVLPLHSIELMTGLAVLAWFWLRPLLWGYLAGAAMHLGCDVLVNGDHVLKRKILFYIGNMPPTELETAYYRQHEESATLV